MTSGPSHLVYRLLMMCSFPYHADYIGRIHGGDAIYMDPAHKNHEPLHGLFPNNKLPIRASGPAYVLSHRAAAVVHGNNHTLRHFANEGRLPQSICNGGLELVLPY